MLQIVFSGFSWGNMITPNKPLSLANPSGERTKLFFHLSRNAGKMYLLYMVFGAKCNYTYTRPITGASSLVTGSVVMVNMVDMVVIAAATRPR